MIKFVADLQTEGRLYLFGLSEGNLNRLEFNNEPIFFSFGYVYHPELFGLILYMGEFENPADIAANSDEIELRCLPFFGERHGVTVDSLRVFPIARSVMQQFRSTPFWALQTKAEITNSNDIQMFFSGRTEQEIEQHLRTSGLVNSKTKRTSRGFGKNG
ncbi:hypothetical protein H6F86_21255 [Phormidium sp. FACHB-592]|uniref:Uncharacterized protein n=1 Tax=Stenomitos frigidus AS-A4 TaxID=2933935 RepID=A0ABV0KF95_9CYAN|nr:hypothetical protein [Phormidium sp. FACHB-592]MBD2076364.1 hypothetical protein [Phormidium sp. FACHB-592]